MTRALPFTEQSLKRAIAACRKAGLTVTGIRADGTVMVQDGDLPALAPAFQAPQDAPPSKWDDVEA